MAKSSLSFKKGDDFLKHYLKRKRKLNWKKHTVCAATQNSEKFEGTTQVLPYVYRTAGPIN